MKKVFYHSGTIDSKLCAWILNKKSNVELIPFEYTNYNFDRIKEGDDIFFCGITLNPLLCEQVESRKPKNVHVFARNVHPDLPKHFNLFRSDSSAASEVWAVVASYTELPKFLREINEYYETGESKQGRLFVKALSLDATLEQFFNTCDLLEDGDFQIIAQAHGIDLTMNKFFSYVESIALEIETCIGRVAVINSPKLFNEFLKDFILSKYPNVLMYHDAKGYRHWTFMSKEVDTRLTAEFQDGYGSKESSGWITTTSFKPEEVIFKTGNVE